MDFPYAAGIVDCVCGNVFEASSKANDRHHRIQREVARWARVVGWLKFFSQPGEVGAGDTYSRLKQTAGDREIARVLAELGARYSCCGKEAVQNLNERWPY